MNRKQAITYLKVAAAMLVVNSHIAPLYPQSISFLSFGGLFGNVLFFFVSGYCLSNCVKESFPKWIAKRAERIYVPYLLVLPILFALGKTEGLSILDVVFPIKQYHFIASILTAYPVFYFSSFLAKKREIPFSKQAILYAGLCIFSGVLNSERLSIATHYTIAELSFYLAVMTLGGMMTDGKSAAGYLTSAIGAIASFAVYTVLSFMHLSRFYTFIFWTVAALFAYFSASFLLAVESKLPSISVVQQISDLTLEFYLIQFTFIDIYKDVVFPIGILFCVLSIAITAKLLSVASSFLSRQLFSPLR